MKKYTTPEATVQPIATQSIMQSSGSGSATGSPSTGFSPSATVGQGGMEAKQTITSFIFKD